MASTLKVDTIQTNDGTGTIALQNQLSGMTTASLPALGSAQMPTGSVLQVLIVEDGAEQSISTTTYTDTGLSLSITPSSTSSKILCLWNMHAYNGSTGSGFGTRLVRGSTNVFTTTQLYDTYMPATENRVRSDYKHLDSPSTTSAITYKVQVGSYASKTIVTNPEGGKTQLVLMEIAG